MRFVLTAALLLASIAPSFGGDTLTMFCRNPRQAYEVVFDTAARTLTINPDTDRSRYLVLAVEKETVAGMVGHKSGLGFTADFRTHQVTLYSDEDAIQTDACSADAGL